MKIVFSKKWMGCNNNEIYPREYEPGVDYDVGDGGGFDISDRLAKVAIGLQVGKLKKPGSAKRSVVAPKEKKIIKIFETKNTKRSKKKKLKSKKKK